MVSAQLAQRRFDNVTTSCLTLSQRCGTVESESCVDFGLQRCDSVAVRRCQDVATTLLQRHHNIKHLVSITFYYEQFWFLSCRQNVKELLTYLSIESSLWQVRRTLAGIIASTFLGLVNGKNTFCFWNLSFWNSILKIVFLR